MDKFPLEKILEISKEDYLENVGKELRDYELAGVHVAGKVASFITTGFSMEVPLDAEVVVDYHIDYYEPGGANAYGLALIPRKKNNPKKKG